MIARILDAQRPFVPTNTFWILDPISGKSAQDQIRPVFQSILLNENCSVKVLIGAISSKRDSELMKKYQDIIS